MTTNSSIKQLGFIKEESTAIVENLNLVLANYQLHYQKLRNFHWNVKGPDFFDIHEQFEVEYNDVKIEIDEIAERIRIFNATPLSNLSDYLEISTIKEAPTDKTGEEMVREILQDFGTLSSFIIAAVECSNECGDIATTDMLTKYLKRIEKRHWMFTAFVS
jgi:starvation-inducible DNA-binding protein